MNIIRRAILAFALIAGITPAFAQVPPPVPALPDTERRTTYSISGSLCTCAVGFHLFGDSTDYTNWLEVFVNGALIPQSGNWTITSPTGSLATIPRPITDAVLTFTAVQTGTVQIVGARRPRRASQFNEGAGVSTRNFNVVLSDLTAQNREVWDKINDVTGRSVRTPPGETLALLPVLASRANMGACFDSGGNLTSCVAAASGSFIAGNGILFTGTNPTTIKNNIQAGPGIAITGANPLTIANNIQAGAGIAIAGTNPLTIAAGAGIDTNIPTTKIANYPAANVDCGAPLYLGGNALFTLTVNAANTYTANCHLIIINTDTYSGVGTGRGKIMAVSGITQHVLYPGQKLDLRQNGSAWATDQQLAGSFGQVWNAAAAVTFFVDNAGSNSANDGLASGASGSFQTLGYCTNAAYNIVYTRNFGSVTCSPTAGQVFQEFLTIFYQINGGGTLLFSGNGGAFTWKPPNSSYAFQFGDGAMVGLTNVTLSGSGVTTPQGFVFGHNHGVLDVNTGVTVGNLSGGSAFLCDFDTHFNFNNGIAVNGSIGGQLYNGCQGSKWNINGAHTYTGSPTLNRFFNFLSGSLVTFQGNVTFSGAVTSSVGLVSGNSVLNNLSGAVPTGGAPTPTTGGQYCTTLC